MRCENAIMLMTRCIENCIWEMDHARRLKLCEALFSYNPCKMHIPANPRGVVFCECGMGNFVSLFISSKDMQSNIFPIWRHYFSCRFKCSKPFLF